MAEEFNGIGTLSEKSIHAYLKDKYSSKDNQEVQVGRYIADVKIDNQIIEIQTQNFKKLLPKLEYYISEGYSITVVYPYIIHKEIYWLNPITLEIEDIRKSTRVGDIADVFKELYWIIGYIEKEQIALHLIGLDVIEYKKLDGYGKDSKKRATKIDKVPLAVEKETIIENRGDLRKFIPSTLNKTWTIEEYKKATKSKSRYISSGLKLLREHNIIEIDHKEKNKIHYKVIKEDV